MGASWELLAYIFGALGAHDQQQLAWAMARILLTFLAPLWINAFVYMTVARMVHFFSPDHRVRVLGLWTLRGAGISKWFIWADVITFLVQAGGASMAGPGQDPNTLRWGLNVYMIGIGVQQGCILVFVAVMISLQRKLRAVEKDGYGATSGWNSARDDSDAQAALEVRGAKETKRSWRPLLHVLYAVLLFITVSIFPPHSEC
jgi:hypothetical protein